MGIILVIFLTIIGTIVIFAIDGKKYVNPCPVIGIFGVPGSGKSTIAAKMMYQDMKKGWKVYTDDDTCKVKGVEYFDDFEFKEGRFLPKVEKRGDQKIVIYLDEIGILFNNRDFKKNFIPETLEWWKKHRHYQVKVIYCSQTYDDMDLKIRNLTDEYFVLRRSRWFFPQVILAKHIQKRIDIVNSITSEDGKIRSGGQIADLYKYTVRFKLCWLPKWVKKFDSFRE